VISKQIPDYEELWKSVILPNRGLLTMNHMSQVARHKSGGLALVSALRMRRLCPKCLNESGSIYLESLI
jgi:hypothetical protein